jgi:glycosyltransferase involved in cell wall biosynthesis
LIIVYHKYNRISKVFSSENGFLSFDDKSVISEGLYKLAVLFPQSKIVWCEEAYQQYLNLKEIESIFHHNKMMLSYSTEGKTFLGRTIGYVEQSPFIKINKKVSYPTWQMSSLVGVVHASLLIEIKDKIKCDVDFNYYLNSVAKVCMPLGLICYSEPKLLSDFRTIGSTETATIYSVFKFVKQHYKTSWVFLLFLNLMIYEKKFHFFAFLGAFFLKNRNKNIVNLDTIIVHSSLKMVDKATVDVVIPTIGRKKYLYDVLCDLRNQTQLPKNVIIVEQNPRLESVSELDYLTNETWPFTIKHTFIHRTGVCNARNSAVGQVESEWVFLADDDIRFEDDLIEKALLNISNYGTSVLTTSCVQLNEKQEYKQISQSGIFGSGNSFLKSDLLKIVGFNESFEFGYGEDTDFGMQLRNYGTDIIYFPEIQILHLKAPIGGFRTKPELLWQKDSIQPKPSPTIMLCKKMYNTKEQILGYKLVLFIKLLKSVQLQHLNQFLSSFHEKWKVSLYWAKKLEKNENKKALY